MVSLAITSDLHAGFSTKTVLKHERFFGELAEEYAKPDGPDALLIAGDLVSTKQSSMKVLFRTLRNALPMIPVSVCMGNHDWWDKGAWYAGSRHRKYSFAELSEMHEEAFREYGIHYVGHGPMVVKDVAIVGFDGWYWDLDPPTNDRHWLAHAYEDQDPFAFMGQRSRRDVEHLLDFDDSAFRATVCMTHFPPFTEDYAYYRFCASQSLMDPLTQKFDALVVGHSHRPCDFMEIGCRVVNPGSDYEKPQAKFIEI